MNHEATLTAYLRCLTSDGCSCGLSRGQAAADSFVEEGAGNLPIQRGRCCDGRLSHSCRSGRASLIIGLPAHLDHGPVILDPRGEPLKRGQHTRAHRRQLIFDTGGHFWKVMMRQQSIAFQVAQRQRQHALRDALDASLHRREAQAMAVGDGKVRHDQNRSKIEQFFLDCGLDMRIGSSSRVSAATEFLRQVARHPDGQGETYLGRIVEKVCDPREYLAEPDKANAVREHLNAALAADG